jgi:hypothetical protein
MPDIDFAAPIVSLCRQSLLFPSSQRHRTGHQMKFAAMNFTPVCHYASLRMSRSNDDERQRRARIDQVEGSRGRTLYRNISTVISLLFLSSEVE